jgi:hypothetical protein
MYPVTDPRAKLTVVTRTDDAEPRVGGSDVMDVARTVIDAMTDTSDYAQLVMVREGGQSSRTVLAVANNAWITTHGEFLFTRPTDEAVFDQMKNAPRTWAIVALTQCVLDANTFDELENAYYALRAYGIRDTDQVIWAHGVDFRFRDGALVLRGATYEGLRNITQALLNIR